MLPTRAFTYEDMTGRHLYSGDMHFEHLIEINDPRLALDFLTRDQLWRGLVMRSRVPTRFARGMTGSTIDSEVTEADGATLSRTLDFGSFSVRDRVRLVNHSGIVITAAASDQWPQSRLSITIEEPAPERLFLRFIYEFPEAPDDDPQERVIRELRREAYRQADIDTVVQIRQLAARGALED